MNEDKNNRRDFDEDYYFHNVEIPDNFDNDDDFLIDVSRTLKEQVNEELRLTVENTQSHMGGEQMAGKKKKKKHKALKITGIVTLSLFCLLLFFVGTKPGRSMLYDWGASIISSRLDTVDAKGNDNELFVTPTIAVDRDDDTQSDVRREDYVANFLLFGIEEIGGGGRTDSIMIASVNIKDNTIKLTSIMRDSYVEIPGHNNNKINAAYSQGGADLLVDTVEKNFKIHIDGWASVNFDSFESVVDMLGGVDIELGKTEANYLNTTNYISDPGNRDVVAGWNRLNGNQALGYARVRKVVTLGGANNDYGRTVRHRRLLNSMFDKYKSKSALDLLNIMYDILPMIKTNLTSKQLSAVIEQVVEKKITTIQENRLPMDGFYQNGRNQNGFVLLLDFEGNINELYKFIYLDEEATPEVTIEPTIAPTN